MKKVKLLLFSVIATLGLATSASVAWAASQSVYAHYKVHGSGNGISSGKSNGVWHYLNKGRKVTLKVTSSTGAGSGSCTLRRNMFGFDKSYGTVSSNKGSHTFSQRTDVTSGSYYLEFYGGNANSTHTIHGTLHD